MMPIVDGPSMLRAIAAEPAYRKIPVIIMSSLDHATVSKKCSGYAAFLRKPFRSAAVIAAIARVLDGKAKRKACGMKQDRAIGLPSATECPRRELSSSDPNRVKTMCGNINQ
jgi:FixJ family two-component response regulator